VTQKIGSNDSGLTGPALTAFGKIAEAWSLTVQEQSALLDQPISVYSCTWDLSNADAPLPELLERVSYILGIYRALHTIFPSQEQADGWVRRPNTAAPFNGAAALTLMCSGRLQDLAAVRRHLEAGGVVDPEPDGSR
jgi:antitoxin Xre/MbcA/ParS-like protein